ncbi:hypothetical protein DFQ27_009026 [Actinomortierella ambigua]|uniref:Kinesin motor domain-containing protein n=1 Tax=Actinomortierella ambigua TaxID=1343610 RepID=A0A9P6PRB7_9FUNG|nr:hypothetical protein DFQ27_009026 [Actinomortierella ambigua]
MVNARDQPNYSRLMRQYKVAPAPLPFTPFAHPNIEFNATSPPLSSRGAAGRPPQPATSPCGKATRLNPREIACQYNGRPTAADSIPATPMTRVRSAFLLSGRPRHFHSPEGGAVAKHASKASTSRPRPVLPKFKARPTRIPTQFLSSAPTSSSTAKPWVSPSDISLPISPAVPNSPSSPAMPISSISPDESSQAKPTACGQPPNIHDGPLDKYRPEMEPIKTYLRLRPVLGDQLSVDHGYINILSDTDIVMQPPANETRLRSKQPSNYKFTKVFDQSATQDTMFEQVGLPLLTPVLRQDHYNTLLFAYGVSNSGKTFTVLGTEEQPGILPRALRVVFESIEAAAGGSDEAAQYCPVGFQDVKLCDSPSQHGLSAKMMSQSEPAWDDSHLQGTHSKC